MRLARPARAARGAKPNPNPNFTLTLTLTLTLTPTLRLPLTLPSPKQVLHDHLEMLHTNRGIGAGPDERMHGGLSPFNTLVWPG